MQLILFRHGDALSVRQKGISSDEERPLSPEGKKQVRASAKGLLALGLAPELVLSSPLVRAMQTAEIIAETAGDPDLVEDCPALAPGNPPERLLERLEKALQPKCVYCVGHQPDLGHLASYLVWGTATAEIPLKKAGACQFEVKQSLEKAELVALLPPGVLAALAK